MFYKNEEEKIKSLKYKNDLISTDGYKKIKEYQLENILRLSATGIEPLILKGMLFNIYSTDLWEQEYSNLK